jgi:RNase H-fold protein (predicted Holliday junction resolvase)
VQILGFLLPLLILVLVIERQLALVPTSYSLKRQLVEHLGPTLEVLVFGTSHAFYDLNPEAFSRPGFNFANTSQSLVIDAQLFQKFRPRFEKLKIVVIALSYFSFEYRLYGSTDDYREYFYPREYGILGDGGLFSLFDLRLFSRFAIFGPEITRRMLLSKFTENHAAEVSALGWFDSAKSSEKHLTVGDKEGKSRAEFHTSILNQQYAAENLAAINSIASLARLHGIQVVLMRLPANHTYTSYLDERALRRFNGYVSQLHEQSGLDFHDYLMDPRFKTEDFYDNDHLNSAAATRFSRIFNAEILAGR